MNFDAAISILSHSNWGFVAVWIALLAVGLASSFPEDSGSRQENLTNRRKS
jgi:hypothetical protein